MYQIDLRGVFDEQVEPRAIFDTTSLKWKYVVHMHVCQGS